MVCALALVHGAHRFRFTLQDGLQLRPYDAVIATACYGAALVGRGRRIPPARRALMVRAGGHAEVTMRYEVLAEAYPDGEWAALGWR